MKANELKKAFDGIEMSEQARQKIIENCKNAERKKNMKINKKALLIAAAAIMAIGVTVFASSGIISMWYSSSSSIPDYTVLPSAEQLTKDIGYSGTLIEEFENGYAFSNGSVVKNTLEDENGKTIEKFKSADLRYEKNGDTVYMVIEKYDSEKTAHGELLGAVNGTEVYSDSLINKIVPEGYEKSEEELRAEEEGKLAFAYDGEDHIVEYKCLSLTWEKDGVNYELFQMNGALGEEELFEMARELIEK